MTVEEIKIRIAKKEKEIAKREKNLDKYIVDDEFTAICDRFFQTKDRTELDAWKKAHNAMWLPEYYSKRYELEDAKATLVKYQKQLEVASSKENTLSEIPEVIKEFQENLITKWDAYDEWKKSEIRAALKNEPAYRDRDAYRQFHYDMRTKWGSNWYEFAYIKSEEIHKANVKAAEVLVLNLVERTVEITGKITDAKYLYLDRDNAGYAIINGVVVGEKGKARVESIGAGGYNIQRYHIRVLVKEVRG